MANQLDLEEQEQLDQLKHFWKQYGNAITWVLIGVLAIFASWNFYQYWQRSQSAQAAAMYDEVERVIAGGDPAKTERAFGDMKDRFGSTVYAQQAGLLVAKQHYAAGNLEGAKSALAWVAEKSSDPAYQAVARLRLAALLLESKSFDEAMKQLAASFPPSFEALVADRKGDILLSQGKKAEALAEYGKAYKGFDARVEYKRLVEVKMNALGVDPLNSGAVAVGSTEAAVAVSPAASEGKK
jgi:predicted negative regulator of RcsB-dependent stress response